MKKTILSLLLLVSIIQLKAQNLELSVQANTNLFHYTGSGSASNSYLKGGATPGASMNNLANDPYGSHYGSGYSAALQAQYVFKSNFILGAQGGYEMVKSKVDITGVLEYYLDEFPGPNGDQPSILPASGQTFVKSEYINFSPYFGYRLKFSKLRLDLLPGADVAFGLNSHETGQAVTAQGNTEYTTNLKLDKPATDIRLKFGVAAWYKRFGITGSYADGLTNLSPDKSVAVHSKLLQLGIAYRIL